MNVPDLVARVGEWLAVVDLAPGGRVVVREYGEQPFLPELLDTCREHKQKLAELLRCERDAAALWCAVFRRLSARADLASNPHF